MKNPYSWSELITSARKHINPDFDLGERLLSELSVLETPLGLDYYNSDHSVAQECLQDCLKSIHTYQSQQGYLSDDQKKGVLDLLSWFIKKLEIVQSDKATPAIFAAIILISGNINDKENFWSSLPKKYISENLTEATFITFKSAHGTFSMLDNAPIWEREILNDFTIACKEQDWLKVSDLWSSICGAIFPKPELVTCFHILKINTKYTEKIADHFDNLDDFSSILFVCTGLGSEFLSEIATQSKSHKTRFAITLTITTNQSRSAPLSQKITQNFSVIFKAVQSDQVEWKKWMGAFNTYPVRVRYLQESLGRSLVDSNKETKEAYLNSISLSQSLNSGREEVATCLCAFAENAEKYERIEMWEATYNCWLKWDFHEGTTAFAPLISIAVSTIDYGVIGYVIENLNSSQRNQMFEELTNTLQCVENHWHRDQSEHNSAWYRALSKWQLIHYAEIFSGKTSWTLPQTLGLPFDPETDRYSALTFPTEKPS